MIQSVPFFRPSACKAGSAALIRGALLAAAAGLLAAPVMAQSGANAPVPAPAPTLTLPPVTKGLTLEHRMLLKCSAAFALVAHGQSQGQADMLGYRLSPVQGREYFVQAMAQVMDDTGLSREEVTEQLTQEAQRLIAGDGRGIAEIMPACEVSLESFTPPAETRTNRPTNSPSGVP